MVEPLLAPCNETAAVQNTQKKIDRERERDSSEFVLELRERERRLQSRRRRAVL